MASSSSSIRKNYKFHVFLSFRGEDVRKTFVDHLYASLKQLGIRTFRDNEELEKGKRIDELFKAIDDSKFFIIVFSKNYASSSWCLKELAKIMGCQDTVERRAYPLFHDVEPVDIRNQSGPVEKAITRHKSNEQFKRWKKALEDAGNLVGWDLKKIANGHEAEAISQIVKEISFKLRSVHLSNDENLVGMESQMQDLELALGIGLDDEVRMIGVKGIGGIGKTTLARAIFYKVSSHFEGSSFVENVREASKERGGLLSLQKQVLKDVLRDDRVSSVQDAISMMKDRMPSKKVLLVLDDVNHKAQLEALAGATNWFNGGSRIIITTRDENVLPTHGWNMIPVDVNLLSKKEAIKLFSKHAFNKYIPTEGYEKLSFEVIRYASGLPLTIKVLGSYLHGQKERVWRNVLKRLETIPWKETLEVLEISFNGLEEDHKEIFLDVACFMKGLREDDAIRILESCGFHAIYGLRVLEQKSLITISNQRLSMHDSIEELGRDIVRRSHRGEPNKHSRLWIHEEIEALLSNDEGTEATACIRLEPLELSPEIIMKGLRNLKKLRVLLLSGKDEDYSRSDLMFDTIKQYLPKTLQFLNWEGYPLRSLPQTFEADNLVGLELPGSRIMQLWESKERKVLKKLRFLDLSDSKLRALDLGMTPNLESLNLYNCHDLTEIHAPARCLESLVSLNLIGCSRFRSFSFLKQLESLKLLSLAKLEVTVESLEEFPMYSRDNLRKLRLTCFYLEEQASSIEIGEKSISLNLQPCTKIDRVSGSFIGLQHLRHLTFNGCIPELPKDLDQLQCLEKLILLSTNITCLPDSICSLKHLKSLKLKPCNSLEELPKDLGHLVCLENLSLSSKRITHLPESICMLKRLKSLKIKSCPLLEEVPEGLGCQLEYLEKLNLLSARIKHLPDSICMMKNLKSLDLESCRLLDKLPEDIGQLECLEKLNLTHCESLKEIPNSICNMRRLRYLYLPYCTQVEKLPEGLGSLECLKELDIKFTGISDIPQSISLLKGLRIAGSEAVLQFCDFATEIETSETETFCYIQSEDNIDTEMELRSQFTENYCNRWWWWGSVVVVVLLLVIQVSLK